MIKKNIRIKLFSINYFKKILDDLDVLTILCGSEYKI